MNVLKSIGYNIVNATIGMVVMAVLNLLIWGEHLKGAATAWLLLFFLIFQTVDIIRWGANRFRRHDS